MVLLFFSCNPPKQAEQKVSDVGFYKPWESLGSLFHDVQMAGIYEDSKTFVDCTPKQAPEAIARAYQEQKDSPDFDLTAFVAQNFNEPSAPQARPASEADNIETHLTSLWDDLTRGASPSDNISTLIPLPNQYVVPGGRFREIYYWDSYFTMIGLGASGRENLVASMVDNFAYLIDTVGFIPNGNRTYYLGRSQPPYFAAMVNLYAQLTSKEKALQYLPAIQREYDFWMDGADALAPENRAVHRTVLLEDGTIMNRYWDFLNFPRPESYKEDVELAEDLPVEEKTTLYRNLRAGAESGWDYSTRWFADPSDFGTIRTVDMLPVDLNCLMYNMERTLAGLYQVSGDSSAADVFEGLSEARKTAIQNLFWDDEKGAFTDYIWSQNELAEQITLAGAYPLYFKVATNEQAEAQANLLKSEFLLPGGLVTTTVASGQQWDYPNGWAPLQWISIKGLEHYGESQLAQEVSERWLTVSRKVFRNTGKMMEKYNVADTTLTAGGGEYPTQDGFGWTNGVVLGLMKENVVY